MKVFSARNGFLVRMERGEEIHRTLIEFAREKGIEGAAVQGIGAVRNAELGYYRTDRKEYDRRRLDEPTELLSLSGNLCLLDGTPFLHAHVVLMREDFTVAGGHLFRAEITATGEFAIRDVDLRLTRRPDSDVGLPLLESGS